MICQRVSPCSGRNPAATGNRAGPWAEGSSSVTSLPGHSLYGPSCLPLAGLSTQLLLRLLKVRSEQKKDRRRVKFKTLEAEFSGTVCHCTCPGCGLIMLTMFFLSCAPPLLLMLGRLPGTLVSLLMWFPWRRRRLKFMSLMLLLSSLFLAR